MNWIYICDKGYPKDLNKKYLWAILKGDGTIIQEIATSESINNVYSFILLEHKVKPTHIVYAYKELDEPPPFRSCYN